MANQITKACFTWAIPGYWIEYANGDKHYSPHGQELTEEGRRIANQFPCNCFKPIPAHCIA